MGLTTSVRRGKWFISGKLLDTAIANTATTGGWQPLEGVFPVTITVSGTFAGGTTVTLYVENGLTAPADVDANYGVLQTYTAPGVYILQGPAEWIKAAITGYTSGDVTVSVEASEAASGVH